MTKKYGQKKKRKKGNTFLKGICIFSFLGIGLILFLTKSTFFNIKEVLVEGENLALKQSLDEKGKFFLGQNLLFVKPDDVKDKIKENPYIKNVNVSKKFPSTIRVDVEESDVAFYIGKGKNAYILSSTLRVLEKNNNGNLNKDIKNLVEIVGISGKNIEIGNYLVSTEEKIIEGICEDIYKIKKVNKTKHKISKVDFSNLSNIKIWIGQVEVRVGDGRDFVKKINDSLNILEDKNLKMDSGYIDLSFNGAPVINRNVKGEG
ncbi:MAG: cell division protein FtsQ/DivIB [Clostridium sp.]|uniref:cell division protein FtsQ/DivIB n=1 Tax=Clostridium sp. TaxID=1506 RepID=UPI003F3AAD08